MLTIKEKINRLANYLEKIGCVISTDPRTKLQYVSADSFDEINIPFDCISKIYNKIDKNTKKIPLIELVSNINKTSFHRSTTAKNIHKLIPIYGAIGRIVIDHIP